MFEELGKKTIYSIILPFSIILEMYDPNKGTTELVSRYENDKTQYDNVTYVKASTLTRLFFETKNVIKNLGLEQENYIIKRLMSPDSININGFEVNHFPVISVHDKSHGEWARKFVGNYRREVPF